MTQEGYKNGLLRETREELARADAKASVLLAASGIAFAALLATDPDTGWYPDHLSHGAARISAWVAIVLTLLGIASVGSAVKPRLRAKPPEQGQPHYFADVEAYWPRWWQRLGARKRALESGRREFVKALDQMADPAEESERLDDQIWALSHIAYRKYRMVSVGITLYALAAVAAIVAFVVEKQWL